MACAESSDVSASAACLIASVLLFNASVAALSKAEMIWSCDLDLHEQRLLE